jgi:hypothetical protein
MYEFGNPLPRRVPCGGTGATIDPVAAARAQVLAQQLSATKTSAINTAPQGCRLYSGQVPVTGRGALVSGAAPSSAATGYRQSSSPCGGLFTGNATCGGGSSIFIPLVTSIRGATSWGRHPGTTYTQSYSQQNYVGTTAQCSNQAACAPFIPLTAAIAAPFDRTGRSSLLGQGGFRF